MIKKTMNNIKSQVSEDITRRLFLFKHLNWNKVPKTKYVFLRNCTVYNYPERRFPLVNERLSYCGCIFSKEKHDPKKIGAVVYNTQDWPETQPRLKSLTIIYSEETFSALVTSKNHKTI